MREEVRQIQELLGRQAYIADRSVATSVYLAMRLGKPLLIEGPAGVGKTEIAKVLAARSTLILFGFNVMKDWTPRRRFMNGIIQAIAPHQAPRVFCAATLKKRLRYSASLSC